MVDHEFGRILTASEWREKLEVMLVEHRPYCRKGTIPDYIPELAKADCDHLAASLCLLSGEVIEAGDTEISFTMQSVSKVIALALALMDCGEKIVFDKVGMEPTGDPFNSIVKLETTKPNKPLNPMINAGAIAVTSLIQGRDPDDKLSRILQFIHALSGSSEITYSEAVARSESETANLNRSLAYFLKEHRVIDGDIEEILELYFKQCAVQLKCRDMARIGAVLANNGKDLNTDKQLIPAHIARICKTFMVTCGMYNASGEFAIKVGIPAKSGVSGAIMGAIPYHMGIGVYSPALDEIGNSLAGIKLLESMSERWQLSIF